MKPLVELLLERHRQLVQAQNPHQSILLEEFASRLLYYRPYFLEKAAAMFIGYGPRDCPQELVVRRLQVMNVLVLVDRFPVEILDSQPANFTKASERVYWINITPRLYFDKPREEWERLVDNELANQELFS